MTDNSYIKLHDAEIVNDKVLLYKIAFSKNLNKIIFSNQFYVKYDKPISKIEKDILNIPGLACIAPIAWATGSMLFVDTLDRQYNDSMLSSFQNFVNKQYNNVFSAGKISVNEFRRNQFNNSKPGLFFSGGIDSTSVYIQNRNRKPDLITIIGGVIPVNNRKFVIKFKKHYKDFARKEGVEISFIETNIREVVNEGLLTGKFGKQTGYRQWWRLVHSLIQISLSAPITQTNKIGSLHYANSRIDFYDSNYRETANTYLFSGNEGRIRLWSDVDVIWTNLEVSRQQEVKTIQKFIKSKGYVKLQVCNFSPKYNQFNCGICDKCLYTMTSLILEGLDPERNGFPVQKNFSNSVNKHVFKGNIESTFWKNIQNNIPKEGLDHSSEQSKLFEWLKTQNFSSRETAVQYQVMKYYLFKLYAVLPKPIRVDINWLGRNIIWYFRKNLIHLLSS
jgi:hypothetical protein